MTFHQFWHWLSTSRYTRQLERENAELRVRVKEVEAENHALIFALGRRPSQAALEASEADGQPATPAMDRLPQRRMSKRVGFSQVKKQLELS